MNRQEATKILKEWRGNMADHGVPDFGEKYKALGMAIEALEAQQELVDATNEIYAKGYNAAKREIALSGEYERAYHRGKIDATKWIPVGERLPIEDGDYLAQYRTGSMDVIMWAEGWNCYRDIDGTVVRNNEMKSIVAWMELPAPYKGGDTE